MHVKPAQHTLSSKNLNTSEKVKFPLEIFHIKLKYYLIQTANNIETCIIAKCVFHFLFFGEGEVTLKNEQIDNKN